MSALKLVSLNVERSKHLDTVLPFIEREMPDVLCLQELMEYDIPLFESLAGALVSYAPMHRCKAEGRPGFEGLGIFSRLPASSVATHYYWEGDSSLEFIEGSAPALKHAADSYAVQSCDLGEGRFRIATTHFTWTPDGLPDDFQRQDMRALLAVLSGMGEFVLCGDFNAPRAGEIWNMLAENYRDNIPPEYQTSLDKKLHRIGRERPQELEGKLVDGLFTTPAYRARDVRLEFGVSDHAGVVASIEKV